MGRRSAPTWAARARPDRPWSALGAPRSRQGRPRRRSESPRTRQDRLRRRSESPRACQDRPWAAILVDLGGLEGRFWKLFDALSLEQAHSLEEATTYEKPANTYGFYWFFSCPLLRARFENQPKIDPKTLRKRVARPIVCERRFFSSWRPQNGSQKSSRPRWEVPWDRL